MGGAGGLRNAGPAHAQGGAGRTHAQPLSFESRARASCTPGCRPGGRPGRPASRTPHVRTWGLGCGLAGLCSRAQGLPLLNRRPHPPAPPQQHLDGPRQAAGAYGEATGLTAWLSQGIFFGLPVCRRTCGANHPRGHFFLSRAPWANHSPRATCCEGAAPNGKGAGAREAWATCAARRRLRVPAKAGRAAVRPRLRAKPTAPRASSSAAMRLACPSSRAGPAVGARGARVARRVPRHARGVAPKRAAARACGIFGVFRTDGEAAAEIYEALMMLQVRGTRRKRRIRDAGWGMGHSSFQRARSNGAMPATFAGECAPSIFRVFYASVQPRFEA